jgi:hypothetical protein
MIEDSLTAIQGIEDSTERAMALGGLISTLFKIKGVVPVMAGRLSYDCYVGDTNTGQDLILCTHSGTVQPRLLQEVLGEQLQGEGMTWKWQIAGVPVEIQGEIHSAHKELCRDFQTDFGIVKLMPLEELIAERVLASIYPRDNEIARDEAKRLMAMGLANVYDIKWPALQALCDSNAYRVGEQLATLRGEAKQDVDAAMNEAQSDAVEDTSDTTPLPDPQDLVLEENPGSVPDPASDH